MPGAGDVHTYLDGSVRTFLQTAQETGGELLEMEMVYPPKSNKPVAHYHPHQEERFEVLSGEIKASLEGVEKIYRAGDSFTIPANIHHWMHNPSEGVSKVNWQVRPALITGEFFDTLHHLDQKNRRMDLMQMALMVRQYQEVFRLSSPPHWLIYPLAAVLTPVARLLGYRLDYK